MLAGKVIGRKYVMIRAFVFVIANYVSGHSKCLLQFIDTGLLWFSHLFVSQRKRSNESGSYGRQLKYRCMVFRFSTDQLQNFILANIGTILLQYHNALQLAIFKQLKFILRFNLSCKSLKVIWLLLNRRCEIMSIKLTNCLHQWVSLTL